MAKHTFQMIIEIEIEGSINQKKFFGFIKSVRHRISSRYKSIQIVSSKLLINPSQIDYPTDKTVL
jgi:hypothetical protein